MPADPAPKTANLEEMVSLAGVSMKTFRTYLRKWPDFPVLSRGTNGVAWSFDVAAALAFLDRRKAERDAEKPSAAAMSPSNRLKLAQALMREDELEKARANLVSVDDMAGKLSEILPGLAQMVTGLPRKWGDRHNLPPAVVADMTRDAENSLRAFVRSLQTALRREIATDGA